jgi:hypothetical protein
MTEKERNQQVAERITEDLRWNGQSFRLGQTVALLDGNVVAVAEDLDQALKALRCIDPDPSRGMVVEVMRPVIDIIR